MEDLIPIVFFAVAWLMAAAGNRRQRQQRRQRAEEARGQGSRTERRSESAPRRGTTAEPPRGAEAPRRGRDLIPKDVWAEIEAMASGGTRSAPTEQGRREPARPRVPTSVPSAPASGKRTGVGDRERSRSLPVPPSDSSRPLPGSLRRGELARRGRMLPEERRAEAVEPVTELPWREVATSELAEAPALEETSGARRTSRGGRGRRAALGLSEPGAARRAMILQEVLGPPLALRPRPGSPSSAPPYASSE